MQKKLVLFILSGLVFVAAIWIVFVMFIQGPLAGELKHDFGIVYIDGESTVVEHTFRMRNRTNHTLQLVTAKPTCGCTTTDWPSDPVLSGDDLVIPVQLKLERSQLRKSQVRLIFESGEEATLRIQGAGRFREQLICTPPSFTIGHPLFNGVMGVLRLEWYGEDQPPQPIESIPTGIQVELDQWRLSTAANTHTHTPQIWTIRMHVSMDTNAIDDMSGEYIVGLTVGESHQLQIPVTIEQKYTFGNP